VSSPERDPAQVVVGPPSSNGGLAWVKDSAARRPWVVLAVSLLAIAVSIAVQIVANSWKENFAANADRVTAQVVGTNSYIADLHTITVHYRRGGRDYETTHNVVSASPYEVGDSVEVLVDRGFSAVAHLEKPGDFLPLPIAGFYVLPAVAGGFGLLLLLLLLWLALRAARRRVSSGASTDHAVAQTDLQPRSTNGFAVASLVLGLLWIFWVGSILALVFGYKARQQIDRSGGTQQGRRLATAGIVLGYIWLAWFIWLFVTA
jgi:hypothetical protein